MTYWAVLLLARSSGGIGNPGSGRSRWRLLGNRPEPAPVAGPSSLEAGPGSMVTAVYKNQK